MGELVQERYASLLFQAAKEESIEREIYEQLQYLSSLSVKEEEFIHLLKSAYLGKQERKDMIERVFGNQLHRYVVNFLKLLVDKGRLALLPDMVKMYKKIYYTTQNIREFVVTTAVQMTGEQEQNLKNKLRESNPGKEIELVCLVDPDMIGGLKLKSDDRELDRSFESMLKEMKKELQEMII